MFQVPFFWKLRFIYCYTDCRYAEWLCAECFNFEWSGIYENTSKCKIKVRYSLAGKPKWRGRLSTVDLLVITSLDQLLFKLKILPTFFTKQSILIRRSTVLSLPPLLASLVLGFSVRLYSVKTQTQVLQNRPCKCILLRFGRLLADWADADVVVSKFFNLSHLVQKFGFLKIVLKLETFFFSKTKFLHLFLFHLFQVGE